MSLLDEVNTAMAGLDGYTTAESGDQVVVSCSTVAKPADPDSQEASRYARNISVAEERVYDAGLDCYAAGPEHPKALDLIVTGHR